MSTPMYDLPEHLPIGVDKDGHGPVMPHESNYDHEECWCGDPDPNHVYRTYWHAPNLRIKDEPLIKSLIEYRQDHDRFMVSSPEDGNLVSSMTNRGTHMPILDLDFPHHFEKSTTEGHTHLYIDVEMSRFKLIVLVLTLWYCGIIEMGHAIWTIRRGASFVRIPGQVKKEQENTKPTYGWFRKLK